MSRYDGHPQVSGYGPQQDSRISEEAAGYSVTRDGTDYEVLPTGVFGWVICQGPGLDFAPATDGGFAIGYPTADDAISAALGEQPTNTDAATGQTPAVDDGNDNTDDDTDGM